MNAAAKEYGSALYGLAVEERCEDEVLSGIELIASLLEQNPEYLHLLCNPAVSTQEHLSLLDDAFRGSVHIYALNFVKILCEKHALDLLQPCIAEYKALLFEARNILPVTAYSAIPLDEPQKASLCKRLEAVTGKSVILECRVDTSLIGGIKICYSGQQLDGSIAGRLASLRHALMQ